MLFQSNKILVIKVYFFLIFLIREYFSNTQHLINQEQPSHIVLII